MSYIKTAPKKNSNILRLLFEQESINLNPEYQRNGDIWTLEKRQLLIDSILNDYDIPKFYFHILNSRKKQELRKEYAVIEIPAERLGRFLLFPIRTRKYIILLDDVIRFGLKGRLF